MHLKLNAYPVLPDLKERIEEVLHEAIDKRAKRVEITCGPSVILKKQILSFLSKKHIRKLYRRLEKTEKGWGRVYLHL